jgi:hypothetical protein
MDTPVTLSDGGTAVVITAPDFECPRPFDVHPQLCILPSADLPQNLPAVADQFPPNTRIVLIGGELPRLMFGLVRQAAERRQAPWLHRSNPAALGDVLAKMLAKPTVPGVPLAAPAPATPESEGRRKGRVSDFIRAEADLSKGSAEEARRLMGIAQQRGIATTFGSLSQAISQAKRKAGATGVPKSIQPASVKALNTLDESIAGLQLIREYVETVEQENLKLREEKEKLRVRLKRTLAAVQELSSD